MDGTTLILFVVVVMFLATLLMIASAISRNAKMTRASAEALMTSNRLAALKILIDLEQDEKLKQGYKNEVLSIHYRVI